MTNKEFIETIAPIVVKYSKEYGIKYPSCVISQACIESAYGQSKLSKNYNNLFGLKCGSNWVGDSVNLETQEVIKGSYVKIRDDFRVFKDLDSGIKGYFAFIHSIKRYSNLFSAINPIDYLEKIVADGYCTSTNYVTSCLTIIKANNLEKYDRMLNEPSEPLTVDEQRYIIGKNYKTKYNLHIRVGGGKVFADVPRERLTVDARKHSNGSILNAHTTVTIKEVKKDCDGNTWIRIPSGWICAIEDGSIYVE